MKKALLAVFLMTVILCVGCESGTHQPTATPEQSPAASETPAVSPPPTVTPPEDDFDDTPAPTDPVMPTDVPKETTAPTEPPAFTIAPTDVPKVTAAPTDAPIPATVVPTVNATATPIAPGGKTMYVTGDSVNVRNKASSDGTIVTRLAKDTAVTVYEVSGDWSAIRCADGKIGWILGKYLADQPSSGAVTPAVTATATPAPTEVPATPTPSAKPSSTPYEMPIDWW